MQKKNGMKKKADKEKKVVHVSSTTQGGSNFGQGQSSLGKQQQGTEKGSGSSYENEQGWNNEALRSEDLQPVKKDKK
jgi:hypothetical protein